MKVRLLGIVMALGLSVLVFAGVANAQTFKSADTVSIGSGETVDGSAWLSGSSVNVAGTVNGDVYCAGQTVTVSGTINGDVLCAGQTVTVTGTVNGDVRLAGQTVAVGSNVSGSATVAGQTMFLEKEGSIGSDLYFVGQNVSLYGKVGRDLVATAASATIDSSVGRNVSAYVTSLTLTKSANVGGNLSYTSSQRATVEQGAQINGTTNYTYKAKEEQSVGINAVAWYVGVALLWALMLYVSAIVVALVFPRPLQNVTDPLVASPGQMGIAILVGLLATIVVPVALFFIALTVLGIPFAVVMFIAWVLILCLSGAATAFYLGRVIWRSATNAVAVMAVGALILLVLMLIPVLGGLVTMLSLWLGSGAILMELRRYFTAPRYTLKPVKTSK